jgi:MFS family permease
VTGDSSPRLAVVRAIARALMSRIETAFGGPARTRVIVTLGAVLALSSADTATVGASATSLRSALHISNADIGLLVAVNSLVAAAASIPFGVLADKIRRTRTLGLSILLWGACMVWSATVPSFGHLLVARLFLGIATASAGPVVASMLGDWFNGAERGRIYSYVLTGELLGAGLGFAVTGDIAALSWRLAFLVLALPAFALAVAVLRLPEPIRGGGAIAVGAVRIPESNVTARRSEVIRDDDNEPEETDAQRFTREQGVEPHHDAILVGDPRELTLLAAAKYILSVRTNVVMIIAGAFGYFYFAGVQTFGAELAQQQYGLAQPVANLLVLVLGGGAVIGVLAGGRLGDWLLGRGILDARLRVAWIAAGLTVVAFVPALTTHHALHAMPYLVIAALGLSAQNPPLNAARLDIMPSGLWGRAEGIRTFLQTMAQAAAPLLFGFTSDVVFGGGTGALRWTFLVMLLPLVASAFWLFRATATYPRDVATAASARLT